jgi:hypothetical protein
MVKDRRQRFSTRLSSDTHQYNKRASQTVLLVRAHPLPPIHLNIASRGSCIQYTPRPILPLRLSARICLFPTSHNPYHPNSTQFNNPASPLPTTHNPFNALTPAKPMQANAKAPPATSTSARTVMSPFTMHARHESTSMESQMRPRYSAFVSWTFAA